MLNQLEERREDSEKYIQAQEKYADLIISFISVNEAEALRITLPNDIALDNLVLQLSTNGQLDITHEFIDDNKQVLTLQGHISKEAIELIAYDEIPELEDLGVYNSSWEADYNGIIQLVLLQGIFYQMNHE